MGGQQSYSEQVSDFPIQNYLNRGLVKEEVVLIRRVWDSFEPREGRVNAMKIREKLSKSRSLDELNGRTDLDFDSFFDIFSRRLIEEKRRMGKEKFDSCQEDASCLFCPYSVDKGSSLSTV